MRASCAPPEPSCASAPPPRFGAMAVFGKLAYDEGATVGTLLVRPLRARGRAVLGARPRGRRGGRRPARRSPGATSPSASASAPSATPPRPAATSPRSTGSTRRCSRCCSTRSRRSSPSRAIAARPRARRRAPLRGARARARRPRARRSRAPGRARSTRSARRSAWRRARLQRLHPRRARASPARCRPPVAVGARLHRRRRDAHRRLGAARRPAARARVTAAGWGWLAGLAVVSTVGAVEPLLRRPAARRAHERRDPLDRRAARHRAARVRSSSARRSGPLQLAGGALVIVAVLVLARHRPRDVGRSRCRRERPAAGQGRARGRRHARRRARHRRRARRGGRDRLLHRPQHARAALGGRPARRRSRRPPSSSRAAGGEGIAVAVDHLEPGAGRARSSSASTPSTGRLDVLVNDIWGAEHLFEWNTPLWEHDLDNGLRLLRLGDRHAPDHEPPRAAAADPRPGRPRGRGHRRHAPTYNADHYRVIAVLRPRQDVGDPAGVGAGAGARRRTACTAVALTPGWMRSEAMLEHYGVTEANWRDATERTPHFCISETPALRRPRGRRARGRPRRARAGTAQSLSSGAARAGVRLHRPRRHAARLLALHGRGGRAPGAPAGDAGYR